MAGVYLGVLGGRRSKQSSVIRKRIKEKMKNFGDIQLVISDRFSFDGNLFKQHGGF